KYREAILEYDIIYPMARSGHLGNALFNNFRVEGSKVCWDFQKFVGGYGIGFKLPSSVKGEEITYKVHGKGVGGFTISVSEHSKDGTWLRQQWVPSGTTENTLTISEDSDITFIVVVPISEEGNCFSEL